MKFLHCLRAVSATLIVAMASSCAGPPPGSQTLPSVARNAHDVQQPSASPQSTASAQPTSPGQYVRGTAAPAFPTALTSGPVSHGSNGYQSQTDAANTYTNVFDSAGTFGGQLDTAQTGANGLPIGRITDANNHQVQMNVPSVSGLPENTATTVGDLQITKDTAHETVAMTGLGLTANGSYDAASDTFVIQLSNNSTYRVAAHSVLRRAAGSRLHPRDGVDCALRIVAMIAAIAALTILIVAAAANCAGIAAAGPLFWITLGGCLYTLGLLVAAIAAMIVAVQALQAECNPTPVPTPTPAPPPPPPPPTPTDTPASVPTDSASPASTQTPIQSPSAPASPMGHARHGLSFSFTLGAAA